MVYVVSDGQLAALDRMEKPKQASIQLGAQTFAYGELWRTQPQMRTVVDFLARNIAQIGLHLFRRVSDTDRERVTDHRLAAMVRRPNPRTTRYRLIDSLVHDIAIYDVGCWWRAAEGLIRLPPAKLEPIGDSWVDLDGVKLKGSRGSRSFGLDELVLFRGYSPTGVWGTPPAETLRQTLLEEWNANQYRQQLWRNGARIPGTIERPTAAKAWSERARAEFKSDWQGLYTGDGPGAGGTPVLEDGMKFVANGVSPKDAEYVSARKLSREEVAAAYHVPLPMVGILEHATFSNIKEQHQQLYQDCLGPWLVMIQEELELQLLDGAESDLYFEFNLAEKMRGTFEEQASVLQTSVGGPWMTRNEARGRVNLPYIEGGDELIVPLNVIAGGQASPTDSAPKSGADVAQIQAAIRAAIGGN